MDQNKLFVDKWFKMPPKANKLLSIKIEERGNGKKSHKGPSKKKSKKRG